MAQNAMWHDVGGIFFSLTTHCDARDHLYFETTFKEGKMLQFLCSVLKDKQCCTLPKQRNSTETVLSSDNNVFLFLPESLFGQRALTLHHIYTNEQEFADSRTLAASILSTNPTFSRLVWQKNSNFPADVSSVSSQFDTGLLTGEQVQ